MNRRTFLGLLFVGGAGAAMGWSALQEYTSQRGTSAEESAYRDVHQEMLDLQNSPNLGPSYEFDYDELSADQVDHSAVERIRAQAAPEADGDRLELVPGSMSADRLREWLLSIWFVEDTIEVTGTVENEPVRLRGGEAQEYTYLVSVPESQTDRVWAIRGETADAARRIANS